VIRLRKTPAILLRTHRGIPATQIMSGECPEARGGDAYRNQNSC